MHQSDDPSRRTAAVTCYLDESGTHDTAPIAVVGGLLLNKDHFEPFDEAWRQMLEKYSIAPPLHMKDFRRPNGRLANISNNNRQRLFADAIQAINAHKIYSVAAVLSSDQYRDCFDKRFCKEGMGVYGACFILCAHINYLLAKQNNYQERIAFLMDSGNPYADHVRGAHAEMQEERWQHMRVGSLTFDDDKVWTPLQAADVIAWTARIRAESGTFDNGYEPLEGLFDEAHVQEPYPERAITRLAANLDGLRQKGTFPL